MVKGLKIETENLVKKLVEQLNDLKTSIKVNESKIIQEKEEFVNNKNQLINALETEKDRIKYRVKKDTSSELNGIQTRGDVVKSNLILQLQSLKEIHDKLIEQKSHLISQYDTLSTQKIERIKSIELDIIKSYEVTGNENLAKIETAYINTIKNQELHISELKNKKINLVDIIKRLDDKKNENTKELSGKLISSN